MIPYRDNPIFSGVDWDKTWNFRLDYDPNLQKVIASPQVINYYFLFYCLLFNEDKDKYPLILKLFQEVEENEFIRFSILEQLINHQQDILVSYQSFIRVAGIIGGNFERIFYASIKSLPIELDNSVQRRLQVARLTYPYTKYQYLKMQELEKGSIVRLHNCLDTILVLAGINNGDMLIDQLVNNKEILEDITSNSNGFECFLYLINITHNSEDLRNVEITVGQLELKLIIAAGLQWFATRIEPFGLVVKEFEIVFIWLRHKLSLALNQERDVENLMSILKI